MRSLDNQEFRSTLSRFRDLDELPEEKEIIKIASDAVKALEKEGNDYRPSGSDGMPGGLLDFSSLEQDVILVPDLHARPDFILKLLDSKIVGPDVLTALEEKRCTVLCVGDCFHTETTGFCADRWRNAYYSWEEGKADCPEMRGEMHDCFATILPLMILKKTFPENFHFLKGNHENILNETGNGNYAFRKYSNEGQMVYDFIDEVYSEKLIHVLDSYEKLLPIVALFRNFAVSHAEPRVPYGRKEIIDYKNSDSVILNFTWTDNGEAEKNSVIGQLQLLDEKIDVENFLWFGGHRPVRGRYALRQDGKYIQFHNPMQMNVVHYHADSSFELEKDIVSVLGE